MSPSVVLVTGASRGIGQAIALELGKQGAIVVGTATSEGGAQAISTYLNAAGIKGQGFALNVNDATQTEQVMVAIRQQFGEISILVNNAGIRRDGVVGMLPREDWQRVIDVNLTGTFLTVRDAVALMPKILVGEFMLRNMRNIRVVGIAPGYVNTPILQGMNQAALAAILQDVHLGRLVDPVEIARLVQHCVENDAIDGTTLEITGGVTYHRSRAK